MYDILWMCKGDDIMEKIFDSYKGVVVFYLVIILLAFVFTFRIKELNKQVSSENIIVNESIYA